MPRNFCADLHMHTDYDSERDSWHGDRPELVAQHIAGQTRLDFVAITEHNNVSNRFFDVQEELGRLTDGTNRAVHLALGAELTMTFAKRRYHVGYVFEDSFQRNNLPDLPPPHSNVEELEHYRIDYPGVAIFNHPTWKDRCSSQSDITRDFMSSGLIDGVEIVNGSMLWNGADKNSYMTQEACHLFVKTRKHQEREGLPITAPVGSSDAHEAKLIGCVGTEYRGEHPSDLFRLLRQGNTKALGIDPHVMRPKLRSIQRKVRQLSHYLRVPRGNSGYQPKDD